MRITGGSCRGRMLIGPADRSIRPTSDRARLAIFNMLLARDLIQDAVIMDAFCGTGALGLEALSRGAKSALFIDAHRTALDLARRNASQLGLEQRCGFYQRDAGHLPPAPAGTEPATLIFMDPPYHQNLVPAAVQGLTTGAWAAGNAVLVIETERGLDLGDLGPGLALLTQKHHGAATVHLYTWTQP